MQHFKTDRRVSDRADLQNKILNSLQEKFEDKVFLHTSPHNDDVMLGYLPYIHFLLKHGSCDNHHFATLTSGFNGVTDRFLCSYKKISVCDFDLLDKNLVKNMKGEIRRLEELDLWQSVGVDSKNIFNLDSSFYGEKSFYWQPNFERDVRPLLDLFEKIKPDFVTVAVDPKCCGPDTHYQSLLVVASAIEKYSEKYPEKNLGIIGYRNVWSKFDASNVNFYFPVSLHDMKILQDLFNKNYLSQLDPSCPCDGFNGTFAQLSCSIMMQQYDFLKNYLGKEFFEKSTNKRLREARGFIFLKKMTVKEFLRVFT